jgi:hypothetical protein
MGWSYNLSQIGTSPLYQVRAMIGDTLPSDPQLDDEEIAFFISKRSTPYGAAELCCLHLATKFSRSVDSASGGTRKMWSQLQKQYSAMAAQFRMQAASAGGAMPYAGGISEADKLQQEQNGDRVPPQFVIGMEDNITLPTGEVGNETPVPGQSMGG